MAIWQPQVGTQANAISARWCHEMLFGGARGGGKSDFLLGDFLQDVPTFKSHWHGIIFRKSFPELEELLKRANEIYPSTRAKYAVQEKTWYWPNGATLKFRYCERVEDLENYQGHQYTWIGIDEATNIAFIEVMLGKLRACLRSAHNVPFKRIRISGNPGGAGHQSIKSMFVDPAPLGNKVHELKIYDPIAKQDRIITQMYIPSKVSDNRILLMQDPLYVANLSLSGSPEIVRAWLEGDWSVITGAYFSEFKIEIHTRSPFAIPQHWLRFRAIDWGSARPFSIGWWAVASEDMPQHNIKKGCLVKYREWYGASKPNVGLKLYAEEVARGILARQDIGEESLIKYTVLDSACFAEDGGASIAERMQKTGIRGLERSDKTRLGGADQIRSRLVGEDNKPMIVWFSTCVDSIRTIPALQHDTKRPEDVDTNGEDHAYDEAMYAALSRPYTRPSPTEQKPMRGIADATLAELFNIYKQENKSRTRV